jgi:hypothetical protein
VYQSLCMKVVIKRVYFCTELSYSSDEERIQTVRLTCTSGSKKEKRKERDRQTG